MLPSKFKSQKQSGLESVADRGIEENVGRAVDNQEEMIDEEEKFKPVEVFAAVTDVNNRNVREIVILHTVEE